MSVTDFPPNPPLPFLPARTVVVPDRGEFFLRDSGGDGTPVMLLHGWMASADLNWAGQYADLVDAGYRVLAIDHRGHGRGLRPLTRFRLADCAADAAAVLRELDAAPAVVVGYSMGGAIAQLVARDEPDVVTGLVVSATAQHWQDPALKRYWMAMGLLGVGLALFPARLWGMGFKRVGLDVGPEAAWLQSELMRHSARDVAEAGRELGRFDSRPWLGAVDTPSAVVLTTRDDAVPPSKQRELAAALSAPVFEAPINHMQITGRAADYNPALLQAIDGVLRARPTARVISQA